MIDPSIFSLVCVFQDLAAKRTLVLYEDISSQIKLYIYLVSANERHDDERLFYIAIFPAPNGRVDDYTDRPHKLIYPS